MNLRSHPRTVTTDRPAAVTDAPRPASGKASEPSFGVDRNILQLVDDVHHRLLQEVDLATLTAMEPEGARRAVEEVARRLTAVLAAHLPAPLREDIVVRVIDEVLGLGPLEPLLADPSISEIMVNDFDEIYYERDGLIHSYPVSFKDRAHVMRIIDRITSEIGRRIDEASPMVDARLRDGSRVNAAIPPVVPRGPVITIRKFRSDKHSLTDLIQNGTVTEPAAEFLALCVRLRLNTLISGGTGSGKTTFLNALSQHIPDGERIITIEDPTELQIRKRHLIAMEARPANIEGRNAITQRDLFRNTLRMRPDRIIVGEVRGGEAFEMLQAMNTGHDGSLTTVHANAPRDALSRVENMVLMAGYDLPVRAIREQIASALHLVVHLSRLSDGSRRVTHISEVTGMESDVVTMQDIFRFRHDGLAKDGTVRGELEPTGLMPSFAERFRTLGHDLTHYVQNGEAAAWMR